jgi:hypothetical protein
VSILIKKNKFIKKKKKLFFKKKKKKMAGKGWPRTTPSDLWGWPGLGVASHPFACHFSFYFFFHFIF